MEYIRIEDEGIDEEYGAELRSAWRRRTARVIAFGLALVLVAVISWRPRWHEKTRVTTSYETRERCESYIRSARCGSEGALSEVCITCCTVESYVARWRQSAFLCERCSHILKSSRLTNSRQPLICGRELSSKGRGIRNEKLLFPK